MVGWKYGHRRVRAAVTHMRQRQKDTGGGFAISRLINYVLSRPSGELSGSFLPVAEKYGMIAEIDRWVISQAARLAGSGQNVEANLSADSISDLSLLTFIEHELRDAGADPANSSSRSQKPPS